MSRKYIKRYRVDTRLGEVSWRHCADFITLKNAQASAEFWAKQYGAVSGEPFHARIVDRNTKKVVAIMANKIIRKIEWEWE